METQYPSLSERVQSIFIDTILIILLMFLFASILERFENTPDWIRIALFFGIWGVYEPLCMTLGCTAGNYFKKIRVRKHVVVVSKINIFQAYIRYITKFLLGWLSFITIHMNPEKRAIHDIFSGTVMIKL